MGYKQYCKDYENIENYEKALADNFKGWHCHHRLETHTSDGERRAVDITAAELQALDTYYDRPPEELIFLTRSEHKTLHNKGNKYMLGKHLSEETKKKMSDAKKGKKFSEEHKKKLSEAHKNISKETRKKMSDAKKGKKNHLGKRHSEETKKKLSEKSKGNTYTKGTHWYNNGKVNIMSKECPDGFIPGMLRK